MTCCMSSLAQVQPRNTALPWKGLRRACGMDRRGQQLSRRPVTRSLAKASAQQGGQAPEGREGAALPEATVGLAADGPAPGEASGCSTQGTGDEADLKSLPQELPGELRAQAKMAAPLALGLVANYSLGIISFSFVGQLGTAELAAAALGSTLYSMSGKLFMMGLCGAVDTYASQAAGRGDFKAMGTLFLRAVLFLSLHAIPITALFFGLPSLLRTLGQAPELAQRAGAYLAALLPAVWIDAVYRPLNRVLVAQGITLPQMWVGGLVAAQHVAANQLLIHKMGLGLLGAAYATVWSNALATLLLGGYVWAAGLQGRVWSSQGSLSKVFQGWPAFAKLAYASAAMKCIESWSFSLCTVVAGWLPDPDSAVAAIAVAFNLYGILFMVFSALALAVNTRVGNALGAGKAALARRAALAGAVAAPFLWVVVATILVTPACQRVLLALFTRGADELLLQRMRNLLYLVVILELFDGAQTVMSGVVSGAGKQAKGFLINAVAYWVLALPAALLLAFTFGRGVEGLYSGMVLGPLAQCCCYLWLVGRLRWREEAAAARRRLQEASAAG